MARLIYSNTRYCISDNGGLVNKEGTEGFGGFGKAWGPHSWRMRLGQRGWLRPTVLKILEDKPMNGIEIMNKIQEMSMGWWRPSPGSIYPLLEVLNTENMIRKREDGKYELTQKYKSEFGPVGEIEEILTNIEGNVSYLEELRGDDKSKVSGYKKRIVKISNRLSEL
jgi:DNA-binding PadR family transcriptional regulator